MFPPPPGPPPFVPDQQNLHASVLFVHCALVRCAYLYLCIVERRAALAGYWVCTPPTHTSTPSPLKKNQSGAVPAERGGLHSIFILHTAAHSPGDYADLNWYLSTCVKASAITLRSSNTPPAPPLHPLSTVSLQTLEQLV